MHTCRIGYASVKARAEIALWRGNVFPCPAVAKFSDIQTELSEQQLAAGRLCG
jgi:hypothetical protein